MAKSLHLLKISLSWVTECSLTAENKEMDVTFRLGKYLLHLFSHTMGHRALPVML